MISGMELVIPFGRSELPAMWTELAELIRVSTGEPHERRVLTSILATIPAMVDMKLGTLGEGLGMAPQAEAAREALRSGENSTQTVRDSLSGDANGATYLDFEVIKAVAILASEPVPSGPGRRRLAAPRHLGRRPQRIPPALMSGPRSGPGLAVRNLRAASGASSPNPHPHRSIRTMGKGKRCPECSQPMYAGDEKYEAKGTWVTYVCRNGNCASVERGYPAKEKVFES